MIEPLKILDTFAGIGGFSYAAEKLVRGFETTQFVEIDPYCQKILKKHWPHVPIHDDIKTFTASPGQYDVITGGFPCQDISVAGLKKGITKQSRSGLFYELIRVIRLVRPKFIVLENVAAILNNGLDIVLGELSKAGYDAEWAVISASSLGACHRRSRWWLVAYPKSERLQRGMRNSEGKGWEILQTEQHNRNEIWSEVGCIDGIQSQKEDASSQNSNVTNTNSIGCGGRNSERRSIQERNFFQREPKGGEKRCQTEGCNINASYPDSDGHQGQCFEKRNKATSGQDTQIIRSTNTSDFKRQSNDGNDIKESRVDENLSGSSDGGKTISTTTGEICDLSKTTNNDQGTGSQDNYQENNDRTLVSEGQSGVQLSQHRKLGRNKTTSEDNSIRYGDDNSSEQRMDNQESNVTNSNNYGLSTSKESRSTQKTNGGSEKRKDIIIESERSSESRDSRNVQLSITNTDSIRTQGKNEGYNPSWKVPIGDGKTRRTLNPNWREYVSEPVLCRGDDGLRGRVDRLKALGNSVVVQVAAIPLQRVHDLYYK